MGVDSQARQTVLAYKRSETNHRDSPGGKKGVIKAVLVQSIIFGFVTFEGSARARRFDSWPTLNLTTNVTAGALD